MWRNCDGRGSNKRRDGDREDRNTKDRKSIEREDSEREYYDPSKSRTIGDANQSINAYSPRQALYPTTVASSTYRQRQDFRQVTFAGGWIEPAEKSFTPTQKMEDSRGYLSKRRKTGERSTQSLKSYPGNKVQYSPTGFRLSGSAVPRQAAFAIQTGDQVLHSRGDSERQGESVKNDRRSSEKTNPSLNNKSRPKPHLPTAIVPIYHLQPLVSLEYAAASQAHNGVSSSTRYSDMRGSSSGEAIQGSLEIFSNILSIAPAAPKVTSKFSGCESLNGRTNSYSHRKASEAPTKLKTISVDSNSPVKDRRSPAIGSQKCTDKPSSESRTTPKGTGASKGNAGKPLISLTNSILEHAGKITSNAANDSYGIFASNPQSKPASSNFHEGPGIKDKRTISVQQHDESALGLQSTRESLNSPHGGAFSFNSSVPTSAHVWDYSMSRLTPSKFTSKKRGGAAGNLNQRSSPSANSSPFRRSTPKTFESYPGNSSKEPSITTKDVGSARSRPATSRPTRGIYINTQAAQYPRASTFASFPKSVPNPDATSTSSRATTAEASGPENTCRASNTPQFLVHPSVAADASQSSPIEIIELTRDDPPRRSTIFSRTRASYITLRGGRHSRSTPVLASYPESNPYVELNTANNNSRPKSNGSQISPKGCTAQQPANPPDMISEKAEDVRNAMSLITSNSKEAARLNISCPARETSTTALHHNLHPKSSSTIWDDATRTVQPLPVLSTSLMDCNIHIESPWTVKATAALTTTTKGFAIVASHTNGSTVAPRSAKSRRVRGAYHNQNTVPRPLLAFATYPAATHNLAPIEIDSSSFPQSSDMVQSELSNPILPLQEMNVSMPIPGDISEVAFSTNSNNDLTRLIAPLRTHGVYQNAHAAQYPRSTTKIFASYPEDINNNNEHSARPAYPVDSFEVSSNTTNKAHSVRISATRHTRGVYKGLQPAQPHPHRNDNLIMTGQFWGWEKDPGRPKDETAESTPEPPEDMTGLPVSMDRTPAFIQEVVRPKSVAASLSTYPLIRADTSLIGHDHHDGAGSNDEREMWNLFKDLR